MDLRDGDETCESSYPRECAKAFGMTERVNDIDKTSIVTKSWLHLGLLTVFRGLLQGASTENPRYLRSTPTNMLYSL